MTQAQPRPADFEQFGTIENVPQLCARYGVTKHKVLRWRSECGFQNRRMMTDAELEQVRTLVAEGMTARMIGDRMGRSRKVILDIAARIGAHTAPNAVRAYPKRERPADFTEQWGKMTSQQLCAHYRASNTVIARWVTEAGLKGKKALAPRPRSIKFKRAEAPKPVAKAKLPTFGGIERSTRDTSHAGQAADFLRRFSAVVRCDATGRYNATGTHYRRGSTVLTGEEVIARAERLGFDPNAWARLAA